MEYALDLDLEHTCRICLSQADSGQRLFSLFSSAIVDGFLVSIPEAITFCVDLQIVETTELPSKICQTCKSQMLSFYTFKHKCKRTEQLLQETVSRKRSEHVEETSRAKQEEQEVHDATMEDEEEVEQVMEKSAEAGDNGEDNVMFEIAELVQCDTCEKMFEDEDELKQHVTLHYEVESVVPSVEDGERDEVDDEAGTEVESQSLPPEADQDEEYYEEVVSLKDFPEECRDESAGDTSAEVPLDTGPKEQNETLIDVDNNEEPMTCSICNAKFLDPSRFRKHKRAHAATAGVVNFIKFYFCNCKKVFQRQDEFLLHIKNTDHVESSVENASTVYECAVCSQEMSAGKLGDMKLHILSHQAMHSCPFVGCGCEYASLARLGVHIHQKHVEHDSYRCQHCGMDSFDSMADLQQHLRLKCTAKKFPCSHCDKKFLTQRSLANHLKSIDKRFHCEECGKSFAQQGELTLHQRIHNGERPFQCTVCSKSYKSASLRTAHMDSHIEGKTFQCQICNKQLQTRTCYRNHIKRHSEEKKHGCDECPKKFYTKYQAKIHMEKVHSPNKPVNKQKKLS